MNPLVGLLRIVDPLVILLTGIASYYIRFDELDIPGNYQTAIVVAFLLSMAVLAMAGVYRFRPPGGLAREFAILAVGWLGVVVALVTLMFMTKTGATFSRQWLGIWSALAIVALVVTRVVLRATLSSMYSHGIRSRRIVVAGAGQLGQELVRRLKRTPWAGLTPVAFYDDATQLAGTTSEGIVVRGSIDLLPQDVAKEAIDQVWIALPLRAEERIKQLLEALTPLNVLVRFVPDIYGFRLLNHSFTEVAGLPVVNVTESPLSGMKGVAKWIEDKVLAVLILAVIWPVLLAIAIGVKLSSPGPVIFRQRRGGLDNREIVVWKFRTMVVHEEQRAGQITQATRGDRRVTPFGAFLRRTSLDELPQFINVLLGTMSIVGPRPHPLPLNDFYRDKIPTYMLRSWIKPGVTGWAQVNGWRGETDEVWKMEMRVQHDLYYIENWSVWFDLYIVLLTVFRLRSPQAY